MGMLLITHDLGVVAQMATRVGVMYAGADRRRGATRGLLFVAAPSLYAEAVRRLARSGTARRRLETIPGQVPPLSADAARLPLRGRCPHAWELCRQEAPAVAAGGRRASRALPSRWPGSGAGHAGVPVRTPVVIAAAMAAPASAGARGRGSARAFPDSPRHPAAHRRLRARGRWRLARTGAGRTLALVGESGCGKTTVGKAILQLIPPVAAACSARAGSRRPVAPRASRLRRRMQMIFQDPFASLNPRMAVGEIIGEGMRALAGA
jgi:peptide/nickel transport system ATP-binding protein